MFVVTYSDGSSARTDDPKLPDMVAMERHFGISAAVLGTPEARYEWTAYLVWHRLTAKLNGAGEPFEAWLDRVEDFAVEEEAADPTSPESPPE
jgi:hypothetical protein